MHFILVTSMGNSQSPRRESVARLKCTIRNGNFRLVPSFN